MEKIGEGREDSDDNITWRMRFTCRVSEDKHVLAHTNVPAYPHTHAHACALFRSINVSRTLINVTLYKVVQI